VFDQKRVVAVIEQHARYLLDSALADDDDYDDWRRLGEEYDDAEVKNDELLNYDQYYYSTRPGLFLYVSWNAVHDSLSLPAGLIEQKKRNNNKRFFLFSFLFFFFFQRFYIYHSVCSEMCWCVSSYSLSLFDMIAYWLLLPCDLHPFYIPNEYLIYDIRI
jgi:hypothetical protein